MSTPKTCDETASYTVEEMASCYAWGLDKPHPIPKVAWWEQIALYLFPRVWLRLQARAYTAGWHDARASLGIRWKGKELLLMPTRVAFIRKSHVQLCDPTRPAQSRAIPVSNLEEELKKLGFTEADPQQT